MSEPPPAPRAGRNRPPRARPPGALGSQYDNSSVHELVVKGNSAATLQRRVQLLGDGASCYVVHNIVAFAECWRRFPATYTTTKPRNIQPPHIDQDDTEDYRFGMNYRV